MAYFLSTPALPPLSPHLLLLRLPQDVNSLKLLIKNILLSPPKVCFPVIFLIEGEMGRRGRQARSGGQAFPSLPREPEGARAWPGRGFGLPPGPVSPSLASWLSREAFLRAPALGATARFEEWASRGPAHIPTMPCVLTQDFHSTCPFPLSERGPAFPRECCLLQRPQGHPRVRGSQLGEAFPGLLVRHDAAQGWCHGPRGHRLGHRYFTCTIPNSAQGHKVGFSLTRSWPWECWGHRSVTPGNQNSFSNYGAGGGWPTALPPSSGTLAYP